MTNEQLVKQNTELRRRLAYISDDIKVVARHIKATCNEQFNLPSHTEGGSVYADIAWSNVGNIEFACDLEDDTSLSWK